jgi:hypothetical protein
MYVCSVQKTGTKKSHASVPLMPLQFLLILPIFCPEAKAIVFREIRDVGPLKLKTNIRLFLTIKQRLSTDTVFNLPWFSLDNPYKKALRHVQV